MGFAGVSPARVAGVRQGSQDNQKQHNGRPHFRAQEGNHPWGLGGRAEGTRALGAKGLLTGLAVLAGLRGSIRTARRTASDILVAAQKTG